MKRSGVPWIPTQEDLLDINFYSIVSDCRAIIAGTLVPRSWSDISTTWDDYVVNPVRRAKPQARKNMSTAKRRHDFQKQQNGFTFKRPRRITDRKVAGQYRAMTHVLTAHGMNIWDARMKARELLRIDLK